MSLSWGTPPPSHCQLRSVGLALSTFVISPEDEREKPPMSWPILAWSPDRGGYGVAALNYLAGPARVNVDPIYDLNHGSWDDEKQTLKDMKEQAWMLMMMVDFNIMEGPWDSQDRFAETVDAMKALVRDQEPEQVPLFMELAKNIMEEANLDVEDPASLRRAWELCGDSGPLRRRHYKCNLNRFHGFTERGLQEQHCWWVRLFQYLFVSIEMDYLRGKKLQTLKMKMDSASVMGGNADVDRTTSRSRPSIDDKAIRASCANAYTIATVMHADITNLWKLKQFVAVAAENKKWQGLANQRLRSVGMTEPWLKEQIRGGFMEALVAVIMKLTQAAPSNLSLAHRAWREEYCGFDDRRGTPPSILRWIIALPPAWGAVSGGPVRFFTRPR